MLVSMEADIEAVYHLQGEVRDVTLRRMARVDLADHIQMFEMFTRMKLVAASIGEDTARMEDGSEASLSDCVEDCIRIWTSMSQSDVDHSKAMAANMVELQHDCIDCVRLLCQAVSRMMHLSSEKDTKIKHLENSLVLAQNESVGLSPAQGRIAELLRACDDTCSHMKQILSKDITAEPASLSRACSNSAFQSTVFNCSLIAQCILAFSYCV